MTAPDPALRLDGGTFRVTRATRADVPRIVELLTDDVLGSGRESADLAPYLRAFERIDADPNQLLVAVRSEDGDVVATAQLTVLACLSRGGATRLQIESVRTAAQTRGTGLGNALFAWCHAYGRSRGATLAQLTSDTQREHAHRFYERLGYVASHVGFKLPL